jgi:hypothetical protein
MARQIIFSSLLLIETLYVWYCLYNAQFLPYDHNYGLAIHAFIVSLVTLATLISLWLFKRALLRNLKIPIVLWFLFGSPFSIVILFMFLYETVFGGHLYSS